MRPTVGPYQGDADDIGSVTLSHPTDSHPDRFPPLSILTEVLIAKDILALPAIKPDNVSPDGFPPLIIRPDGFPPNKKTTMSHPYQMMISDSVLS